MNVVFGVSDAGAAKQKAESAGLPPFHSLDYNQDEIDTHLDGQFKKYEEHFLNSEEQCGFRITLAQIDPK